MRQEKKNFLARYGSAKHLDELIKDPTVEPYDMLANPHFTNDHLQKAIDMDYPHLHQIANAPYVHKNATPEQKDFFANHSNERVTSRFLNYQFVEPRHIEPILKKVEDSRRFSSSGTTAMNLASQRAATPDQFNRMVKINDIHMNQRLSANPSLPEEHIPKFINSSIVMNRMNIATHPKLKPEHMETLSNDERQFVRTNIAGRKDLPEHLIHKLANDESDSVRSEIWLKHKVRN